MSVAQRTNPDRPEATDPRRARRGRRGRRWPDWGIFLGALLLADIVFLLVRDALIDDSYITLSYARNLAENLRWGMFPEETANSATSPLNVLLLALVTAALSPLRASSPVDALGVIFVLANAVTAILLRRAAIWTGASGWMGVLAAALLLCNPLLLSAVGLEMTLAAAGLSALLLATIMRRPTMFGLITGLLVLTRIDLAVFALVLFVGTPALWPAWWRSAFAAATVTAPWFVFSWLALGSAVPDTLVIKQLQEYWGERVFSNGVSVYLAEYPMATSLSLAAPALALVTMVWSAAAASLWRYQHWRPPRPVVLLGLAAIGHYYVYTTLGVPPYHWYYAPSIIGLTVALLLMPSTRKKITRGTAVTFGSVVLTAQVLFTVTHGLPWREAPITTNGATAAEYKRMGVELGRLVGAEVVSSPGEIGTLAYFCRCVIVDEFSDRGYLPEKIEQRGRQLGAIGRWLLELNYRHLDRDQQPIPVQYDLRRVDGRGTEPLWNGDSAYHEPAHFVLQPR